MLATHVGAWALFATWIDLTTYLGRFGIVGEYVYIVFNVSKSLLKCLLIYMPTLIAFSFGFSMLLHSNPAFENWISACLKVLTMMLGELEFDDHFIHHEVKEMGGRNHSVQIMYLLFILIVAVIIMNLIVAMTISATNELRHDGKISQIKTKVRDIMTDRNVSNYCVSQFKRKLDAKISGTQQLPKMVKEFLRQKDVEKVTGNFQAVLLLQPYPFVIFQICVSSERPKPSKPIGNEPITWPYISDAYYAYWGGEYPIYSFTFQKGQNMTINAKEELIKQTREHLAKKKLKCEELESKLKSIKEDLNQKWKNLESELNQFTKL